MIADRIAAAGEDERLAGVLAGERDFPSTDPWRAIGALSQPVFSNGWENYPGTFFGHPPRPVSFFRDNIGFVHLAGVIYNGATNVNTALVLPPGYRPARTVSQTAASNHTERGHAELVVVGTDGALAFGVYAGARWISLDNHRFLAA